MRLLACDPGKVTGLALFDSRGRLETAGKAILDEGFDEYRPFARAARMRLHRVYMGGVTRFVGEIPQVRREGRGDPNDLLPLVAITFRIYTITGVHPINAHFPTPEEWKGSVPKHIHNNRIMAKLTSEEKVLVDNAPVRKSDLHNIIDAIGLGLWALGRLKR